MSGSLSLLFEALKRLQKVLDMEHALNLLACLSNVYYFFKTLICCVPMAGDW
jgi:hypothetical protein